MDKLELSISYGEEFDHYIASENSVLCVNSFDELKGILEDPSKFINHDEKVEEIIDFISSSESIYAVDMDGNELESYDPDSDDYKYVERPQEELDKMINDRVTDFSTSYNKLISGNYVISSFYVHNNTRNLIPFEDIKKGIELVKNNVKKIDISCLDLDEIISIINEIDLSDDIEIVTKYNYNDSCSKSDLIELTNYLNGIKEYVTRFDLSPLEQCIFVNDLLREREYKESDEQANFNRVLTSREYDEEMKKSAESRSIFKVFKSDKIVCAGFSNLYSAILDLLGISATTVTYAPLVENKPGHMANLVFLEDSKYDIKGIYEIDTTWGRFNKKDGSYDYQESINNYYHFANSISDAFAIKKRNKLDDGYSSTEIDKFGSAYKRFLDVMNMGLPDIAKAKFIESVVKNMKLINSRFKTGFLNDEIQALDEAMKKYSGLEKCDDEQVKKMLAKTIRKIYGSSISPIDFKDALYKVKYIEHSIDKDKYPFSETTFNKACDSKLGKDEASQLLMAIFGETGDNVFDEGNEMDISRAELLSVLHKMSNDSVDKDPVHHI